MELETDILNIKRDPKCNFRTKYYLIHLSRIGLEQKSFLDLPDEAIEEIMGFLSFNDLSNFSKMGERSQNIAKRVGKKKPFCEFIIKNLICYHISYYQHNCY